MARVTKADLEARLWGMFDAFDRLMVSHRDLTSGLSCDLEWAKRVEAETYRVRHNLPPRMEQQT